MAATIVVKGSRDNPCSSTNPPATSERVRSVSPTLIAPSEPCCVREAHALELTMMFVLKEGRSDASDRSCRLDVRDRNEKSRRGRTLEVFFLVGLLCERHPD